MAGVPRGGLGEDGSILEGSEALADVGTGDLGGGGGTRGAGWAVVNVTVCRVLSGLGGSCCGENCGSWWDLDVAVSLPKAYVKAFVS